MTYQRPTVTPDNRGPLIDFSTYLLLVSSVLTVIIKLVTRYTVARILKSDDWFTVASLVFAIGQGVAAFEAVRGGLGQHILSLNLEQINVFQKAVYSVDIFYVISVALSKMITLRFVATLTNEKRILCMVDTVSVLNLVWAVFTFFAVCFQCRAPETWNTVNGKCIDRSAFWGIASIYDVLIDIAITLLPFLVFRKLNTSRAKKVKPMVVFATRLLVIPITILRLYYIVRNDKNGDVTFNDFNTVLTTEIATNCSIIFGCISFIKPFLDSVEVGLLASKIRHQAMGLTTDRVRQTTLKYAKSLFHPRRTNRSDSLDVNSFPLISAKGLKQSRSDELPGQVCETRVWADPSISEERPVNDITCDVEIRVH